MTRICARCSEPLSADRTARAQYCSDYCRGMRFYEATRAPAKVKPGVNERFDSYTGSPDANGCTAWAGATFGVAGYGAFYLNGRTVGAHRYSYERSHGPIPRGLVVRHKCDNRSCVEPSHLELGTPADNAHDAKERGRKPNGIYHAGARLSDEQVAEIRAMCASGERQRDVARIYGCTQAHVSLLVRGRLRANPSTPVVTSARRVT